jgi:hypothetical protein
MAAGAGAVTRRRRRVAVSLVAASAVLVAAGIAAAVATPARAFDGDVWGLISFIVPISAFSVVGGVIAVRRPDNTIGWLLAAIGLLFAVVVAGSVGSMWALETEALPKAVGEWIVVPANGWVIALGLIGTQLPLRLPDGRLPSPRWRWFSRLTIALIAVSLVGMAAQPGRVNDVPGTANPLGSGALKPLAAVFLLVILCFVGSLAALVVRYRRAGSQDRAQLRWIAFSGVVFLAIYLVTLPLTSVVGDESAAGTVVTNISQAAFAALPIGIGYAVLRHRLYDIDAVISRTLSYGALTATLGGVYLGSVLVLQLVLSPSSDLAIAGSTLFVAALFRPARGRIQAAVDRRFYRRRYDAARTLESFGGRLRDQVDLDALGADLRGVITETMQPAHVSLWLRGKPR